MGILGLESLIDNSAPKAVQRTDITNYDGLKIALDASISLYQFLIGHKCNPKYESNFPVGTTHIIGIFVESVRIVGAGIRPVFVFNGTPPEMKNKESESRQQRSRNLLCKAAEAADLKEVNRHMRNLFKMTQDEVADAMKLLGLIGIPFVKAPSEAVAQCAALEKAGIVNAVASDDMAALAFGTKVLLRNFTMFGINKIKAYELEKALSALGLSSQEFRDLCILLGCDYCDSESTKGIEPEEALRLIQQHHSLENILENLNKDTYIVEGNWRYQAARHFFKEPVIYEASSVELNWESCDEEAVVAYMCKEKGVSEEYVRSMCEIIKKAQRAWRQIPTDPSLGPTVEESVKEKDSIMRSSAESIDQDASSTSTSTSLSVQTVTPTAFGPATNTIQKSNVPNIDTGAQLQTNEIISKTKDDNIRRLEEIISLYQRREEALNLREEAILQLETQREKAVLEREMAVLQLETQREKAVHEREMAVLQLETQREKAVHEREMALFERETNVNQRESNVDRREYLCKVKPSLCPPTFPLTFQEESTSSVPCNTVGTGAEVTTDDCIG